jgi:hypothetical protein
MIRCVEIDTSKRLRKLSKQEWRATDPGFRISLAPKPTKKEKTGNS